MSNNKFLNIGNITTIINSIMLILAGYIIGWLLSIGFKLPISQAELGSLLTAIVFGLFSYINAKKHNNFWDKDNDVISIPADELTDAQIRAIENFIAHNTPDRIIEDIDPASEYETDGE